MKDKRKSRRQQMRYSAWLALDDDQQHGCAIADISDTGARIDVDDAEAVPDQFLLLLSGNGSPRRKCRVVWRRENQIGVSFEERSTADRKAWPASPVDAGA